MSSPVYDVGVVGGGIIGSCTAYFLKKENPQLKIVLLEQFDFLHRKGSSHGDSRIIRMTYPQEQYTSLMFPAYKFWAEIERESGRKIFTKTGGLDFGYKDNPELLQLIRIAKKYGVSIQIFDNERELSKKFPMVSLPPAESGRKWIAIYSPSSGILNATKAVAVVQGLAQARGVVLRDNVKVLQVSKDVFYHELKTKDETFKARKVIFTTGPWTRKLLRANLNLDLPLTAEQTTIAYWKMLDGNEHTKNAFHSSNFPVFINYEDPLIYGTPAHEFPGLLKCAAHYGKELDDPDVRDFETGQQGLDLEVAPFLKKFFKGIDTTKAVRTESCVYTWTPDADFILDKIPGQDSRLFVGCGFSGHGFKLAPVVGHLLSELVVKGATPSYPHIGDVFSIQRFKQKSKVSKL